MYIRAKGTPINNVTQKCKSHGHLSSILREWNVMPCIRWGSNVSFFAALYGYLLEINAMLVLLPWIKCYACNKRARLDLGSTNKLKQVKT